MQNKKEINLVLLLFFFVYHIHATQVSDTTKIRPLKKVEALELIQNRCLENLMQDENLFRETELQQTENLSRATDMQEIWDKYLQKPLNLNTVDAQTLSELGILSMWQIEALLQYRADYGKIVGLHELKYIQSFDPQTIETLKALVCFGEEAPLPMNFKNLGKYGKHQIILRYQRTLIKSEAYNQMLLDKAYQGNPDHYYVRYTYQWFDRLKLGFVAEKDPGEAFFRASQKQGFDFYGGYLYWGRWRFVKSLVLGSYSLQFGQGLCLWTGGGFGKSISPNIMARSGMGVRPSSSAAEQGFLMGLATTLEWKKIDLSIFFSHTPQDGSIKHDQNSENVFDYIASISEMAYHRNEGEIAKKHTFKQTLMGGHLNLNFKKIRLGATATYTYLDKKIFLKERLDTKFSKLPQSLYNLGFDYTILLPKTHIFGEIAYSQNGGLASLHAVQFNLHPSFSLHIAHLYYMRNYLNYFSSALGNSSSANNEKGLDVGVLLDVYKNISIQAHAYFYRCDWFTYSVKGPSSGQNYQLKIEYKIAPQTILYGVYRFKNKEITEAQIQGLPQLKESRKHGFRLHFKHITAHQIELQTRLECDFIGKNKGLLLYQDIAYTFVRIPL
ncbi:MAG: helix-hairpin-helix domain-containing protein, partial [Bacteroidales bacterium]